MNLKGNKAQGLPKIKSEMGAELSEWPAKGRAKGNKTRRGKPDCQELKDGRGCLLPWLSICTKVAVVEKMMVSEGVTPPDLRTVTA